MLGLADISVALAYLLIFILSLLCVIYGFVKWNSEGERTPEEIDQEKQYMKEELEIEEEVAGDQV